MTLSILIVLISIEIVLYGYLKYVRWVNIKSFYNDLNELEPILSYKHYRKMIKKHPKLKKDIKIIQEILKGKK